MRKQFAVIGLGSFGSTIALELVRLGHEVLGLDNDEGPVEEYAEQLSQTLIADGTNEKVVEELSLQDFDAVVVAIGENMAASILCTLALKSAGVKQVWVKALGDAHHRILSRLGADRIIHPEYEIGVRVANTLVHPQMLDYISLGNGWLIVEIKVGEALAGKTVPELSLDDFDISLSMIKRGAEVWRPPFSERTLATGDQLVLQGVLDNLLEFADTL